MLTPKNSTWAAHKRIAITLGASAVCLAFAFGLMSALGIRINTSYSLPMGIYARTSDGHTNLIEFCPEGHAAAESSERGYRTTGVCPDGAAPLLKPIVARSGDTVEMSARGISVNGRLLPQTAPIPKDRYGRPLQAWPTGRYAVPEGFVWVASSYNRGSYDSRYIGPIPTRLIRSRLKPLWTFSR